MSHFQRRQRSALAVRLGRFARHCVRVLALIMAALGSPYRPEPPRPQGIELRQERSSKRPEL